MQFGGIPRKTVKFSNVSLACCATVCRTISSLLRRTPCCWRAKPLALPSLLLSVFNPLTLHGRHEPIPAIRRWAGIILVHLDRSVLCGYVTCSTIARRIRRSVFFLPHQIASSGNPRTRKVRMKARREWPTYAASRGGGYRWYWG